MYITGWYLYQIMRFGCHHCDLDIKRLSDTNKRQQRETDIELNKKIIIIFLAQKATQVWKENNLQF